MKGTIAALAFLTLAGCALNPVMTPYAFKDAGGSSASQTATVWGVADGQRVFFRKIDGQGLPSRGGGGFPISLTLMPGTYTVQIAYYNAQGRFAIGDMPMTVAAGHHYQTEYEAIPDGQGVDLQLKDLGTSTTCHYERIQHSGGVPRLVCQ